MLVSGGCLHPTVPSFPVSAPEQFSHLVDPTPATALSLTEREFVFSRGTDGGRIYWL